MAIQEENYALIVASKEGDYASLTKLIDTYSKIVHSVIYSIVNNRQLAEDLAQETFLKVINGLHSYEFRAPFKSWILRIAINLCRDYLRRKKVRRIILPFTENDDQVDESIFFDDSKIPDDDLMKKERLEYLHEAIAHLPSDLKQVLVLRDIQEFSYEEIAETLGWRIGTVKSRLFRARSELHKKLSPIWEDVK
jgi:RNA polymerase sigma-70 factor, ECF subfamily